MFSIKTPNEKFAARAILLATLACLLASPAFAQTCDTPVGEPVEVAALAPHLELKLADGRLVRIAGIEPVRETVDNPDFPAKAAADLELWTVGAQVALTALDQTPDRWGRVRARVFLPPDNSAIARGLIEAGWARVDPLSETSACLPALYQAEAEARAEKRGLWADAAYAVLDQTQNPDFADLGGRVVVVSGTVANVNAGRYRTFVNLGKDRRKSLTITLSARTVREFTTAGQAPQSLAGRNLRVRGLLDTRFGPRIEVYSPGAIELLAGTTPAPTDSGWHAAIPAKPPGNR